MGSSGSRKSTLLNIIGLLDNYEKGSYKLDGNLLKDLSETKAAKLRNEMIGFVFQSFNLISFKNAKENDAMPLYYQNISRRKRNKIAMEYLEKMGLEEWADHLPNEKDFWALIRDYSGVSLSDPLLDDEVLGKAHTATLESRTPLTIKELEAQFPKVPITELVLIN